MSFLISLMALLGLVVGFVGFRQFTAARQAGKPLGNAAAALGGGVLIFLLASVLGAGQRAADQSTVQSSPAPATSTEATTPEPSAAPAPASTAPAEATRTPGETLNIVADRPQDDPVIPRKLAYLTTLCPSENASPADMVVSVQQLVKRESGRELEIENILDQFITAQEEGVKQGLKCSETGGMLATLMIKGL